MKTIVEHLAQYAAYHRNRKNVATHLIGIPMIVVGILTLLSRPVLPMEFMIITPASIAVFLSIIFMSAGYPIRPAYDDFAMVCAGY